MRNNIIGCIPFLIAGDRTLTRSSLSDKHVEKVFIYLLLLSILLHLAGFMALVYWPKPEYSPPLEPTFIDLQDLTDLPLLPPEKPLDKARPSDQDQRVARETAPHPKPATPPVKQAAPSRTAPGSTGKPDRATSPTLPGSSVGELLRRKPQQSGDGGGTGILKPDLLPSARRMAQMENNFRRRFADEIEDGSTHFLNTDNVQLGSFLRRFETAVYGVWRYPQEAAMQGIEGVTPVRITFNRNGEITNVKLLDSSGSRILDDEVFRTLRLIGPMGNLPRSYEKDEFHLIAFFQYGSARGQLR